MASLMDAMKPYLANLRNANTESYQAQLTGNIMMLKKREIVYREEKLASVPDIDVVPGKKK